MDRQRKKKIENARVIATNIFMGLSVIAIVFALMLIAMGFNFGEDGGLEQSGLIQIASNPKGASVEIDGKGQFNHTDMSKMLSAESHHIKISKSNYDTWEKDVEVDAGLLTRIEWARLFPINPKTTDAASFTNIRFAEFSSDRKHLIVIEHDSPYLNYMNIQDDKISRSHKLSLNAILGEGKNVLIGTLSVKAWNNDGNKVIIAWENENSTTWYYVDLENEKNAVNLTKEFQMDFTDIKIANNSASKLWALENHRLHTINVNDLSISSIIVSDVEQFVNNGSVVTYVAINSKDKSRKISLYQDGEEGSTTILNLEDKNPAITLAMGTYWNVSWLAFSTDQHIEFYGGNYPSYDKKSSLKQLISKDLDFTPSTISVNNTGRIVTLAGASQFASIDTETNKLFTAAFDSESSGINWLDDYLFWEIVQEKIIVRDFDGDNRREVITNVNCELPVVISENNRWLYYFIIEVPEDDGDVLSAPSTETIYTLKRLKLS